MKAIRYSMQLTALAVALSLPCGLLAGPTVVRINAAHEGAPTTEVLNSENYNIYVGEIVNNPATDYGALINLLGVDNLLWDENWEVTNPNPIPNQGWRFTDPKAPDPARAAVYIIWIEHDDYGPLYSGDLRVGFNQRKPGTGYYRTPGPNPAPGADVNAGPVQSDWVTLYSDANLVLQFKGFKAKQDQPAPL